MENDKRISPFDKVWKKDSSILRGFISNLPDLSNKSEDEILQVMFKEYTCFELHTSVFDIVSHQIKNSYLYYIVEHTINALGYDYIRRYKQSVSVYFYTRFKHENPDVLSHYDEYEDDEFDIRNKPKESSLDLEFLRRGFSSSSKQTNDENEIKGLFQKYPNYGKRIVVISIKHYAGAGGNHWYVKFDVESNPFVKINYDKKVVSYIDFNDLRYTIEDKFTSIEGANNYIEKIKKEHFDDTYQILWDANSNITRYFYTKIE